MKKGVKKVKQLAVKEIVIGIVIGIILGVLIILLSLKTIEKTINVEHYCDVKIETLFERPCEKTTDCFGRVEICDIYRNICVPTALINKSFKENVRMPTNQEECENVGGTWEIKILG